MPTASSPLPLPRLVVRVGGLGNRRFGSENGIEADPQTLWAAAEEAVDKVLGAVELVLLDIHQDARPTHAGGAPSWWHTHALGWFFGQADRWGWRRHEPQDLRVFTPERPLVSLLSGEADGADQLLRARAAVRRDAPDHRVDYELLRVTPEAPARVPDGLGVGEPMAKDKRLQAKVEAKHNLTREEAREWSRIVRRRAYAYRAQSEALRHHSDVLVAVWDPDTEGKAGGTAESVEAALRDQIPVVAIRLTGGKAAEIHMLENLRHLRHLQGQGGMPPATKWEESLREILRFLLAFPDPQSSGASHGSGHGHGTSTAYDPRRAFARYREDAPLRRLWPDRVWRLFNTTNRLHAIEAIHSEEGDAVRRQALEQDAMTTVADRTKAWETLVEPAEPLPMPTAIDGGGDRMEEARILYKRARRRASSDGLSGVYGDAHRGGILVSYLLAALAVFLAIFGGLLHVWHWPTWCQASVAFVEVVLIGIMWALEKGAQTDEWNAAYTDARILAEALRMMEFLGPLGVHTPIPRLPYYLRQSEDAANPDRLWSIWYFRALVRMAPLRLAQEPRLEEQRQRLQENIHEGQRRYHRVNARKHHLLHHAIEHWVSALFLIVGSCAAAHFLDVLFGIHFPGVFEVSLVVCVWGPALIAALHGFASQMECRRLQLRSSSMERLLEERSKALAALDLSDPSSPEAAWGLATEGLATASLLMDETAGWSMLYRDSDIHAG